MPISMQAKDSTTVRGMRRRMKRRINNLNQNLPGETPDHKAPPQDEIDEVGPAVAENSIGQEVIHTGQHLSKNDVLPTQVVK